MSHSTRSKCVTLWSGGEAHGAAGARLVKREAFVGGAGAADMLFRAGSGRVRSRRADFGQRFGRADLCLGFLRAQSKESSKMNTGYFEQMSDCWSSELRPATYYRTVAAQARRLQADATTPRLKQYLDKMIAHCERLAGQIEPGASLSRSPTRRSRRFMVSSRHLN